MAASAIGAGIAVAGGCGLAPPGPTPAGPFVIQKSGMPSRGKPGTIRYRVASCTPCNSRDLFVQRHPGDDLPRPRHGLRMAHMSLLRRSRRGKPAAMRSRNCEAD